MDLIIRTAESRESLLVAAIPDSAVVFGMEIVAGGIPEFRAPFSRPDR
ncbi:MAG: hypothetical protein MZV70_77250 [Desulfobacterales bacterium]|nr:hypothetical protein [Desulfobacterales bacterium]